MVIREAVVCVGSVYESDSWPGLLVSVSAIDSRYVRSARQRWEPFRRKKCGRLEPLDGGGQTDRQTGLEFAP